MGPLGHFQVAKHEDSGSFSEPKWRRGDLSIWSSFNALRDYWKQTERRKGMHHSFHYYQCRSSLKSNVVPFGSYSRLEHDIFKSSHFITSRDESPGTPNEAFQKASNASNSIIPVVPSILSASIFSSMTRPRCNIPTSNLVITSLTMMEPICRKSIGIHRNQRKILMISSIL